MASYYTTTTLIESIKRRAMLPSNSKTLLPADYLAFSNEEMMIGIVPTILELHEEYFVTTKRIPLVSNVRSYQIPNRSIGDRLRDVFYEDNSGNVTKMTRIAPEDRSYFQSGNSENNSLIYYIQGDEIVIPGINSTPTGYIAITFFMRPNELVLETRVAMIQSITVDSNTGRTTFNVNKTPSGMTITTPLDIMQTKASHRTHNFDILPVDVGGTSITFNTSEISSDIVVGDYIAFAGECIIPQIPDELHPVLAQRAALRCLDAIGDVAGVDSGNKKLIEMEQKTQTLVDNRVAGSPQKVTNLGGILRNGRIGRRRRF